MMIVPDQFTMQTQKEMVERHPRHGIMNIDVQSFGRLYYRIADELGEAERITLDDTGKNLVLRRLAAGLKDRLPVIGSSLEKKGYVHELKSLISEFLQYDIGPEELERLAEYAVGRKLLSGKLKDVKTVYEAFRSYLGERYITKEEKTEILAANISRSTLLKGSVVAFDCFTGFTPVQNSVITQLLRCCEELLVSIILPAEELESYRRDADEHRLFSLSMKTIHSLEQLAADAGCPRGEDILLYGEPWRFRGRPALAFLEKNIFRGGTAVYPEDPGTEITSFSAKDPAEEVKEIFRRVRRLTREEGLAYRDIAVISGDPDRYAPYVEEASAAYGIPYFLDSNRKLEHNPVTEFLRSTMECAVKDFAYEPVMQLLRSGLSGVTQEEADELENYILATGVRGRRAWEKNFVRIPRYMRGSEEDMMKINATREKIMKLCGPLLELGKKADAAAYAERQYAFLSENAVYDKLQAMALAFRDGGDETRAKEYEQVYESVCRLLEQIAELLAGEELALSEYTEIFLSGIEEIKLGVLPQDTDRVVIGDMERTRLKPVKVLFFAGLNDGVVPAAIGSGGMISDIDREFLEGSGFALSPTPRQRMFIQRLYLYHALSRPSERLILSHSLSAAGGESLRDSYLLTVMNGLFPKLSQSSAKRNADELPDSLSLALMLSDYAAGLLSEEEVKELLAAWRLYGEKYGMRALKLANAAFYRYLPPLLSEESVRTLYGEEPVGSVSRMERFASCAYAHYLSYGLRLSEREESGLAPMDVGTLCHNVLELFGKELKQKGREWSEVTEEEVDRLLPELTSRVCAEYGALSGENSRDMQQMKRMQRILKRSVQTLAQQLRCGAFRPESFECSFRRKTEFSVGDIKYSMRLTGKIDRVDVLREGDTLYLKVTDYKTGTKKADITELYAGRQLQLPVYLKEAMTQMKEAHPELKVLPAAFFYYILRDPLMDGDGASPEELQAALAKELRVTGLIRKEDSVVRGLDQNFGGDSAAIRVKLKKDGDYTKSSELAEARDMEALLDWAEMKLKSLAAGIMEGQAGAAPLDQDSCRYCDHKEECPFDTRLQGCAYGGRKLSAEEAWERIRREAGEE